MNNEKLQLYVARLERLIGMPLQLSQPQKGRIRQGVYWFTVEVRPVNGTTCDSEEFIALSRIANDYKTIRVEPNGWGKIAIYALDWRK